jgi:hypothetical protein
LCANTTAGGAWSPVTLAAEVAVMFSLFSPGSFRSDILSIGSLIFRKIVGTVGRQVLSILKIPFGGNFNIWYNTVKFSKSSMKSMLVSADIYATGSTDVHPTVLSGTKLVGVFEYRLGPKKLKTAINLLAPEFYI